MLFLIFVLINILCSDTTWEPSQLTLETISFADELNPGQINVCILFPPPNLESKFRIRTDVTHNIHNRRTTQTCAVSPTTEAKSSTTQVGQRTWSAQERPYTITNKSAISCVRTPIRRWRWMTFIGCLWFPEWRTGKCLFYSILNSNIVPTF